MNIKQQIFQGFIKLIKKLLGGKKALLLMKKIIHLLPPTYAFPLTWLCLGEFPLDSSSELEYTYGTPRDFRLTKVKVNPKCLHARFFVMSGYYEEFLTKQILSTKRKGLLVDIGANFGYYSILWLQKNETRAIAVEPVAEYVELLNENLKSYEGRYRVVASCIGDQDGLAFVDTCGEPTMLSKIVVDENSAARRTEMITLKSLLKRYNEDKIDVLKIDAEGYDIKILDSCKPLFEAKIIGAVFWEASKCQEEKKIIQFLEEIGYSKILDNDATGYELVVS